VFNDLHVDLTLGGTATSCAKHADDHREFVACKRANLGKPLA
jgi:hypothetical protein